MALYKSVYYYYYYILAKCTGNENYRYHSTISRLFLPILPTISFSDYRSNSIWELWGEVSCPSWVTVAVSDKGRGWKWRLTTWAGRSWGADEVVTSSWRIVVLWCPAVSWSCRTCAAPALFSVHSGVTQLFESCVSLLSMCYIICIVIFYFASRWLCMIGLWRFYCKLSLLWLILLS